MALRYNKEKLNLILRDFCILTNLSVCVFDADFKVLANYSEIKPDFCKRIQEQHTGYSRCLYSDLKLLKKCSETHKIESHICHAGLLDAVIPIMKESAIIGYMMIGRIRVAKFEKNKIIWMQNNKYQMKKLYYELTEYNKKQIESILRLASMTVSYILSNNIILPQADDFAEKAVELIENNIKEKLSVHSLCRELNVSKNTLYEKFHTIFGTSVNEYIMSKRLQKGKELLKTTDYSISRIADECGIGSYTYFSKLFKNANGISPYLYRKKYDDKK